MFIHPKQIETSGASSGNYLRFNGTLWVPAALAAADVVTALGSAASSVSVNSQKITSLATPSASTDAATKGYVDSSAAAGAFHFQTDSGSIANLDYLFAYLPLGETQGQRNDIMGRVHLVEAGTMPAPRIAGGPSSQEIIVPDFTGNSANYLVNTGQGTWWSGSTVWSISFWFRIETLPGVGNYISLVTRVGTGDGYGWDCFVHNVGGTSYGNFYFGSASASGLDSTDTISTNTWYHYAGTWDGTNRRIYINAHATSDTPAAGAGASSGTWGFRVSSQNSAGNEYPLDGQVCHLAMWRGYALTQADVTALYGSGTPNRLRH
ncbi:MAG: hypothetical protein RL139_1565 [Gemmatimonadota bacterium]|jgi:hypothetical protein